MKQKTMSFLSREVPKLARIRQQFPSDHISDARTDVREKLLAAGLGLTVRGDLPRSCLAKAPCGRGPAGVPAAA